MAKGIRGSTPTCKIPECERPAWGHGWCALHWKRWRKHGDPLISKLDRNPEREARFQAKLDRSGGPVACWPWRGPRNEKGYGLFYFGDGGRLSKSAHRVAYELAHGESPGSLHVCHSCDNPPCCNPAHLWLGTNADNMADRVAKGRQPVRSRTHCKRGHEFTPETTKLRPSRGKAAKPGQTRRECLICVRQTRRAWEAARGSR